MRTRFFGTAAGLLLVAGLLFGVPAALAQPSNDDFDAATVISALPFRCARYDDGHPISLPMTQATIALTRWVPLSGTRWLRYGHAGRIRHFR